MNTESNNLPPLKEYFTWNKGYAYIVTVQGLKLLYSILSAVFLYFIIKSISFLGSASLLGLNGEVDYMARDIFLNSITFILGICWVVQIYKMFKYQHTAGASHFFKSLCCIAFMKGVGSTRTFSVDILKNYSPFMFIVLIISLVAFFAHRTSSKKILQEAERKIFNLNALSGNDLEQFHSLIEQLKNQERPVPGYEFIPYLIKEEYAPYVAVQALLLIQEKGGVAMRAVVKVSPIKDSYNLTDRLFFLTAKETSLYTIDESILESEE